MKINLGLESGGQSAPLKRRAIIEKCGSPPNWSSHQEKSEVARESKHPFQNLVLLKSDLEGKSCSLSKDQSRENIAKCLDISPEPCTKGKKITDFSAL